MDGSNYSPEVKSQSSKDRVNIQAFATRREAVGSLDTTRPDLENRFVADISNGNIFFVKQQYDPNDPKKDDAQHEDIVKKLIAEGKIKSKGDARGGYILVVDPEEGEIMYSGKAGTIEPFADDLSDAENKFNDLNKLQEGDPTNPHFFIIDRTYGAATV